MADGCRAADQQAGNTHAHTHTHPVAEAVSHGPTEPLFPPHVRTTCIDRVC